MIPEECQRHLSFEGRRKSYEIRKINLKDPSIEKGVLHSLIKFE
jgi:hypothetical protein